MGNRIIKETIRTSKSINGLSDFLFRFWVYLITYVDDYGRGSADPQLLKGFVFPRRDGITEAQITEALNTLASKGMITLYESDGELYFCFPKWDKHQQIRAKKSKFPEPDSNGYQMISDVPVIQYESNTNPNPKSNTNTKRENADVHPYGEYGWVKLTEKQYNKLLADLGQEELDLCIQYVDESAQKNHNKNKWTDWNLVIRSCHRENWPKRWRKQDDDGNATNNIFLQIYDEEHGR